MSHGCGTSKWRTRDYIDFVDYENPLCDENTGNSYGFPQILKVEQCSEHSMENQSLTVSWIKNVVRAVDKET